MFHIQRRRAAAALLLSLRGRLDALNSRDLQAVLDQALADETVRHILLDVSGVEYMSASGLRLLKTLHDKTGSVHLITPSNRVREILQITGLDTIYSTYKTPAEALRQFQRITNAHTRLEWGYLSDQCPQVEGAEMTDWLTRCARLLRRKYDSAPFIADGIRQLVDCGTTTIAEITDSGDSIGPILESGLDGHIYIEVSGTDSEGWRLSLQRAQALVGRWRPQLRGRLELGLAFGAPYATHPDLYREGVAYAKAENLAICAPIAQSAAEIAFLRDGDEGRFGAYYEVLGIPPLASPKQTPIAYLEALGVLSLRPLLVGATHLDAEDIARVKASGCAIVYTPRAQLRLGGVRAPIEHYLAQGIDVYLGTGSLASATSLNIYDELDVAVAMYHGHITPAVLAARLHAPLPA